MPHVDDKGTTRRFTPEMAMKLQEKNHELENEIIRLKALNSTQLDTIGLLMNDIDVLHQAIKEHGEQAALLSK